MSIRLHRARKGQWLTLTCNREASREPRIDPPRDLIRETPEQNLVSSTNRIPKSYWVYECVQFCFLVCVCYEWIVWFLLFVYSPFLPSLFCISLVSLFPFILSHFCVFLLLLLTFLILFCFSHFLFYFFYLYLISITLHFKLIFISTLIFCFLFFFPHIVVLLNSSLLPYSHFSSSLFSPPFFYIPYKSLVVCL